MTLALRSEQGTTPSQAALLDLESAVDDWSNPEELANGVATTLYEHLPNVQVAIYRYEHHAESLELLAAVPRRPDDPPIGTRMRPEGRATLSALHSATPDRVLNVFVEPDFMKNQPGQTRSEVAVPVVHKGEVLGLVSLIFASPARPPLETESVAGTLARPLALSLAADTPAGPVVSAEAREPAAPGQPEQILASIAAHLAHDRDLNSANSRIAEAALELVPAAGSVLMLRHADRQMLEVLAVAGDTPTAPGSLIAIEGTVPGSVLSSARPQTAAENEAAFAFESAGTRVRDALFVPLGDGGKMFGVLGVFNRAAGGDYASHEIDRLQRLANLSALLEARRVVGPLRQRLSDASLIAEVGRSVTGTLGVDEVLNLIVEAAQMLVNGECAAVGLLNKSRSALVLEATAGTLLPDRGSELPVEQSLMGWAVLNEEVLVTDSVSDDPRSQPHDKRQGPGVVVPLESRGRVRGAMLVASSVSSPPPTEDDVEALRKLAAYAAIALENARLYEAQQELADELRKQAVELERAYADLRTSQNRLVVSEKMAAMGRVTAGIAHEINSPLGGIMNCLQLASGYVDEYRASVGDPEVSVDDHIAIAADLKKTLTMAETAAQRVGQFVRTIKSQTRMDDEKNVEFDVAEEIESIGALIQYELRKRDLTLNLELEPGSRIAGDPGKFAVVVQNLLSNAMDAYGSDGGTITVRSRTVDRALRLEVEDQGCGIPEDVRPRIFDYLYTTKDVGEGTGLGLAMVHNIVTSNFDGDVDVQSEVGVGTTMIVTLPATALEQE